jgi:ABC-2 type transport system ATP-binding protein
MATLHVTGLRRTYGRLVALARLDLVLAAGECCALIGANGSGKSTAVRAICGLLEPTEGTVRIGDADPHTEPDGLKARAALAFVPDQPVLYDELTVRQHLELSALSHGAADGLDERIEELLGRLGLTARKDFLPAELSRGMRQKTQLACAFVRPAQLLVLDEPVVGLDPPSQTLLAAMLREAKAAGTAVLLTTHQLRFAEGLADRAIRLDEGTVADLGPWDEVRDRAVAEGWTT